jgi:hypothetical protein
MVAFAVLATFISIALAATSARPNAGPTALTDRQTPSAIDFTLYKTTQTGYEDQCWTPVEVVHVAPADVGDCNTADFYTLQIDSLADGWNCFGMFPQSWVSKDS